MVIAFSGSHRSGKTTLARLVAEDLGIEFYETRTGEVMKEIGINMVGDMTLYDRLSAQELLLDHHVQMLAKLPRPLIVDRCPIDMFAYTAGEIGMQALKDDAVLDKRMQAYLDRCQKEMNLHYLAAVVCCPLPAYDAQDGKPPPSRAYQSHIHHLILGGLLEADCISQMTLSMTDLEQRRDRAGDFICDRIDAFAKLKANYWVQ